MRQGPRGPGRHPCPEPVAQRAPPPSHLLGPRGTAPPAVSGPVAAGHGGPHRRASDREGDRDALPPTPAAAGGDGHRAYLRARSGLSRPCPRPLHRGRAARRRRVAAGETGPRGPVSKALAVLPAHRAAPAAEREPQRPAADRPAVPAVSYRLHRQRDEPVPQWPEGGRLLLPLHRPAPVVGTADRGV